MQTIPFDQLPKDTQELALLCRKKWELSQAYHQQYFGCTPPIISAFFNGKRLVALRGSFIQSDDPNYDWATPSDFLMSYLTSCLGKDWLQNETQKQENKHEVTNWILTANPNISSQKENKWDIPNGSALALLHLAYDLYILDHINCLPTRLIDRLKNKENFNGARYEVFVFATLIRAGFKIEYLDEVSGDNGKVADCRAKHNISGEYISVEAKTRNIKGVLGATAGNPGKLKLYKLINNAIEKKVSEPYVIFVDLNLPDFSVRNDALREKIRMAHKKIEKEHAGKFPNLICYTNIPFHYGRKDVSPNHSAFGFIIFKNPKFRLKNSEPIIQAIQDSIDKYAFLPAKFNESDTFADELLRQ